MHQSRPMDWRHRITYFQPFGVNRLGLRSQDSGSGMSDLQGFGLKGGGGRLPTQQGQLGGSEFGCRLFTFATCGYERIDGGE